MLSALTGTRRGVGALVVAHRDDELAWLSLRNVPGVHVLAVDQLNTYDVLASDHVVFTEQALAAFLGTGQDQLADDGPGQDEAAGDEAVPDDAAQDEAAAQDDTAEDEPAEDRPRRGHGRGTRRAGRRTQDEADEDRRRCRRERGPDRQPAGHPAEAGHLGEELPARRRRQVHLPRRAGGEQDADQAGRRDDLHGPGHRREHVQPAGQAAPHAVRLGQAARTPSAPSSPSPRGTGSTCSGRSARRRR